MQQKTTLTAVKTETVESFLIILITELLFFFIFSWVELVFDQFYYLATITIKTKWEHCIRSVYSSVYYDLHLPLDVMRYNNSDLREPVLLFAPCC